MASSRVSVPQNRESQVDAISSFMTYPGGHIVLFLLCTIGQNSHKFTEIQRGTIAPFLGRKKDEVPL